MLILDTNVFSALMRSEPDAAVVAWMDRQPRSSLWTTAVTLLEIRFGLEIMPAGKKKLRLTAAADRMLYELIEGRIRPFDAAAAQFSSELMAARQKKGRPVELRDTMIAGIVLASRATLVTRNTKHFADLLASVIDPRTA